MMKHVFRFTLVEMLVVIAIIGILAGILFPSLSSARAASQKTKCLNNKRNLAQAALAFAQDNDKKIIFSGKNNTPYSLALRGFESTSDKYPTKKIYLGYPAMRCSSAQVNANDSREYEKVSGMFDTGNAGSGWWGTTPEKNDVKMADRFGNFRTESDGKVFYSLRPMKSTTQLILFADVFDANDGLKGSYCTFKYNGSGSGRITALHQGQTTLGFADGHAAAMSLSDLKQNPCGFSNFFDDSFKAVK